MTSSFQPTRGGQPGRIGNDIVDQATANGFSKALETIADWPLVARRVYFLQHVASDLTNKTPPWWLAEMRAETFEGVHDALTAAKCDALLTLVRMSLRQAIDEGCCGWAGGADTPHLLREVDDAWLEAHTEPSDLSWDTLEHGTVMRLLREELWPKTREFIRAHRDELVRKR